VGSVITISRSPQANSMCNGSYENAPALVYAQALAACDVVLPSTPAGVTARPNVASNGPRAIPFCDD
jgi:hypothetical protein